MTDWLSLATEGVRSLTPYEPGKPEEELERELGISDPVKLASNENPLGPSPRAVEAMRGLLAGVARYPDGHGFALKQALSRHLGVDPGWITLGNGSNDVLDLVARAFLGPRRSAVFSRHAFAVYPIATQAVGARARVAAALPADHPDQPFGHDLQAMREAVASDTRVIFIANPNNPTGTWVEGTHLRAFLESLPAEVICVVDEAYAEYVEEPAYPDTARWLDDFPNLVVTRTFSKIHGLAGLRVGYGISRPEVADLLNRVRQPFNVNSLGQAAAVAALEDEEHLRRSRELNRRGLVQLRDGLRARGLRWIPSIGNFLTVDVGRAAGPVYQALLREGVIVRPVANYGFPEHLRVTVGTEVQNTRFLQALDRVLGR